MFTEFIGGSGGVVLFSLGVTGFHPSVVPREFTEKMMRAFEMIPYKVMYFISLCLSIKYLFISTQIDYTN